ncbi:MAG: preprotein translocase subunit SecE [Bryobacteraceae bacterium]|nr:preprotein translocase subunit SecE [Bryobacteraceae bacterium]
MATKPIAANSGSQSEKTGPAAWLAAAKEYINDLKAEMRRVTWPSRKQVQATTAVVIAAVFLFAAYFAVVDMVLGRAITRIFDTLARR